MTPVSNPQVAKEGLFSERLSALYLKPPDDYTYYKSWGKVPGVGTDVWGDQRAQLWFNPSPLCISFEAYVSSPYDNSRVVFRVTGIDHLGFLASELVDIAVEHDSTGNPPVVATTNRLGTKKCFANVRSVVLLQRVNFLQIQSKYSLGVGRNSVGGSPHTTREQKYAVPALIRSRDEIEVNVMEVVFSSDALTRWNFVPIPRVFNLPHSTVDTHFAGADGEQVLTILHRRRLLLEQSDMGS